MSSRPARAALLLVLGVVVVRLVGTEVYLRYVKAGLALPLVVSGVALAVLGAAGMLAGGRVQAVPAPRVGWLLAVPLGLVVLVSPPALGSYGLSGRATPVAASGTGPVGALPPPRDGAVELTLREYAQRLFYDHRSLNGATVRVVGFAVAPTRAEAAEHGGGGFYLTRIALSCCAADGQPIRVFVPGKTPPTDTWWTVQGQAPDRPISPGTDAVLDAAQVTATAVPTNPYISRQRA